MTIEIKKTKIESCDLCGDKKAPQIPNPDADPRDGLVEMIDDPNWKGDDGYLIREDNISSWRSISLCEKCMTKVKRGINLMNANQLTKIAL